MIIDVVDLNFGTLRFSRRYQQEKVRTYSYYYWETEHEKISEEYVLRMNISNYLVFFFRKKHLYFV